MELKSKTVEFLFFSLLQMQLWMAAVYKIYDRSHVKGTVTIESVKNARHR